MGVLHAAKYAIAFIGHYSGLDATYRLMLGPSLSVLMYHRLRDAHDPFPLSVSLKTFQQQIAWLRERHQLLSLEEGMQHLQTGRRRVRYAVTFDDGYADNMKLLQVQPTPPATIFLVSSAIGRETLWVYQLEHAIRHAGIPSLDLSELGLGRFNLSLESDRERLIAQIPEAIKLLDDVDAKAMVESLLTHLSPTHPEPAIDMLDWEDIQQLARSGLQFGGHSHTHPLMAKVSDAAARDEVFKCRATLCEGLGKCPTQFAYPNGRNRDFTQRDVDLLQEAGFELAVTTEEQLNLRGVDPYRVGRFNVSEMRFSSPWGRPSRAMFYSGTSGILGWILDRRRAWNA